MVNPVPVEPELEVLEANPVQQEPDLRCKTKIPARTRTLNMKFRQKPQLHKKTNLLQTRVYFSRPKEVKLWYT